MGRINIIAALCFLAPLGCGSDGGSDNRVSWPGGDYATIRAYVFNVNGNGLFAPSIVQDGKLDSSVVNPRGVELKKEQETKLLKAVTGTHPSHPAAGCYRPRHGFVFYDQADKILGYVEICFECSDYRSQPQMPGPYDLAALRDFCREMGLPISEEECLEFGERQLVEQVADLPPK